MKKHIFSLLVVVIMLSTQATLHGMSDMLKKASTKYAGYKTLSQEEDAGHAPQGSLAMKWGFGYGITDPNEKNFLHAIENGDKKGIADYLKTKSFIQNASQNLFTAAIIIATKTGNTKLVADLKKLAASR